VQTLYPGVLDVKKALTVRVDPDRTTSGIDFAIRTATRFSVTLSVRDPQGEVPEGTVVQIAANNPMNMVYAAVPIRTKEPLQTSPPMLLPGPTLFVAQAPTAGGTLVDVVIANLTGPTDRVDLHLKPGARLIGHVLFEGTSPPLTRPLRVLCKFARYLAVSPDVVAPSMAARMGPTAVPREDASDVAADGSFSIDGLLGDRLLEVWYVPTGWAVQSITAGGKDVTKRTAFELQSGEVVDVVVRLAPRQ
jgi:hypothetical protein